MSTPWDEMASVWLDADRQRLWRRHSDRINVGLVDGWLPGPLGDVLKTDLFDEAVAGGLVPALEPRATSVTGIDLSRAILEAASARVPGVRAVEADVRALPFADASFDTIVSNSTLDHFDSAVEIETSLGELARVLKPGGRLLVTLDNPLNPVVALGKALRGRVLNRTWARAGGVTARVGFTPYYVGATLGRRALGETLAHTGLAVTRTACVVHAPRVVAVVIGSGVERRGPRTQSAFLRALAACERLGVLPSAAVTGHFVAALATKSAD